MQADASQNMTADQEAPPRVGFSHRFQADPFAVRRALKATLEELSDLLTQDTAGSLELVLAEVCNNIVEHGYGNSGHGEISVAIYPDGQTLVCAVGDNGPELPRICLNERPPHNPTDLPEGGFGWFLIRNLVQDLQYHRTDGHNLLIFRLPIPLSGRSGKAQFI